jgi:hypothetical protein
MIPTLMMFAVTVSTAAAYLDPIYAHVKRLHELGGELLFGTDVGYTRDYDTAEEFEALARCGLSGGELSRVGQPWHAFADVRFTIRNGRVIWRRG